LTNIRRSRGYAFEHGLVEKLNSTPNWWARRLGGSSTGLPDVVATNNVEGILLAIECKSTVGNAVYIPPDQVERCVEVCKGFSWYKERHVIFAVKFGRNRSGRKLTYYYKRADAVMFGACIAGGLEMPTFKITYDGRVYSIHKGKEKNKKKVVEPVDYILNYSTFKHLAGSIS
jgi:Holliday junction resolvase